MRYALVTALSLLGATLAWAPAWAQGQSTTRPSAPQNDSQAMTNQGQQPSIAREVAPEVPTATENSVTKPQGPSTGRTSQNPQGRSQ